MALTLAEAKYDPRASLSQSRSACEPSEYLFGGEPKKLEDLSEEEKSDIRAKAIAYPYPSNHRYYSLACLGLWLCDGLERGNPRLDVDFCRYIRLVAE
jgi:hypothetical protein